MLRGKARPNDYAVRGGKKKGERKDRLSTKAIWKKVPAPLYERCLKDRRGGSYREERGRLLAMGFSSKGRLERLVYANLLPEERKVIEVFLNLYVKGRKEGKRREKGVSHSPREWLQRAVGVLVLEATSTW